jgi:hypothetical protein
VDEAHGISAGVEVLLAASAELVLVSAEVYYLPVDPVAAAQAAASDPRALAMEAVRARPATAILDFLDPVAPTVRHAKGVHSRTTIELVWSCSRIVLSNVKIEPILWAKR